MGIIQAREKAPEKGPECPAIFTDVMAKYRALKFVQRRTDDAVKVFPTPVGVFLHLMEL